MRSCWTLSGWLRPALDPIGGLYGVQEFPATAAGYAGLLGWPGGFGTVALVGIEGTGTGRQHRGPGTEDVVVGPDLEALRRGAQRVHRGGGAERCGGETGVAGEGGYDAG